MEAGVRDPWNPGEAFVPECPLCSGKVARDDPAAQALDWGVRTAEAKGTESGFWKVSEAVGVYQASPASDLAIDEIAQLSMKGVMYNWTPEQPGSNPNNPAEEKPTDAEAVREIDRVYGRGRFPPPSIDITPYTEFSAGARCCVEKFQFPVPTPEFGSEPLVGPATDGGYLPITSAKVELPFKTSAVYVKAGKGESKDCDCKCCTFRQYLQRATLNVWPEESGEKGAFVFDKRKREDCKWILVDFTGTPVREEMGGGQESDRPKDTSGGDKWTGPFCYGRKGQGDPPGGKNPDVITECTFNTEDRPFVKVAVRSNFSWRLDYVGVIHDVCNNNVPRRTKDWQYVLSGHVGAEGNLTVTEEKISMDGDREDWAD